MKRRLLALAFLAPLVGSGCLATKRNVQDLQIDLRTQLEQLEQIEARQAAQERRLEDIQRENAALLDTLRMQDVRDRGDFSAAIVRLERQLVQIQALTGQGQQQLAQFREALEAREEEALRRTEELLRAQAQAQDAGDPDELYSTAESALERGSASTARNGFQEFLRAFPDDPRVPAARLSLAKILDDEGEPQLALDEYGRIVELHPQAPEAATALLRSGLIERTRGNAERSRAFFNRVTQAYPNSPEAGQARTELRRR